MRRILRPKDAMAKLGFSRTRYYEYIRRGILPPVIRMGPRCTGHIEEDLDAYIDSLRYTVGTNVGSTKEAKKTSIISN